MGRNFEFSIDEYYHVYNRGTEKRDIFLSEKDFQRFLSLLYLCNNTRTVHVSDYQGSSLDDILKLPRGDTLVDIGAYCLMPNHFHLLVREKKENGISLLVQKLSTGYTMYMNKKYKRSGALFEGKFRAKHVDSDEYLKYLFSYIHLNPVKIIDPKWKETGITDKTQAKDFLVSYKYSSYLDYSSGVKRGEGNILCNESFPDYFQTEQEFENAIEEWLLYQTDFEKPTVKVEP